MKTASVSPPSYHLIDTAPLAARYAVICAAITGFLAAGCLREMLCYSHKVSRLVRLFTRLEAHNVLLNRKLNMLTHKPWRDRVLRELGGKRKLALWEAAKARIEDTAGPPRKAAPPHAPSWLYTPERAAESERLKARVRACGRACAPERVFRDRVKMDFEGAFRLAPLPRTGGAPRRLKVYTAQSLTEYDWNNTPFAPVAGLGPALVWPAEFRAAMEVEAKMGEGASSALSLSSRTSYARGADGGSSRRGLSLKTAPPSASLRSLCGMTQGKDGKEKQVSALPIISASRVISPRLRRDLFTPQPRKVTCIGS